MSNAAEIVVISGKGGTGKTSIASALLYEFGDVALGADCDVDGSNFPILFDPQPLESIPFYGSQVAVINEENCRGCDACAKVCRFEAVEKGARAKILRDACEGCGYCVQICPFGAITMEDRLTGTIKVSSIRTGTLMVHGDLEVGGDNSGRLVAEIREKAHVKARELGKSLIITDGSPGIGCPVVSSISGANYVLLVTEPSLSGIHDLERVAALVTGFSIPSGIVINKADLNLRNRDTIVLLGKKMGLPIMAEFPFTHVFSESLKQLKTLMETNDTNLINRITHLTKRLKSSLEVK
ncbi:ATP-binding protein [Myxococcota bacterium]|nr:ATP-binding protein [Myxococcota bacterium]MBU1536453.1 ATP-binding protein [Myxococcota bacterium]